jgi:polysaccharide pyruvyl transferase WcaK-like protein
LDIGHNDYFVVSIRSWKRLPADFTAVLARFVDYAKERFGLKAVFLPMMDSQDVEISKKVIAASCAGGVLLDGNIDISKVMGLIKSARFMLAMRLHAVIYAAKAGTPFIGLSYDPKVRGVCEIFSDKYWVDVMDVADGVLEGLAEDMDVNHDELSQSLISKSKELSEISYRTAELAAEVIFRE